MEEFLSKLDLKNLMKNMVDEDSDLYEEEEPALSVIKSDN